MIDIASGVSFEQPVHGLELIRSGSINSGRSGCVKFSARQGIAGVVGNVQCALYGNKLYRSNAGIPSKSYNYQSQSKK